MLTKSSNSTVINRRIDQNQGGFQTRPKFWGGECQHRILRYQKFECLLLLCIVLVNVL